MIPHGFSLIWGACISVLLGLPACSDRQAPVTPGATTSGVERNKLIFHEPSKAAQKNHPNLVILIHGLGDTPQELSEHLAELIAVTPARFIAPRGVNPYSGGWGWFAFARPLEAPPEKVLSQMVSSMRRLTALIRTERRNNPHLRVVVMGFSQGGMLSLALALHEPELIDTAIPIAGWLPNALVPSADELKKGRYPPIRAFHGLADSLVPFQLSKTLVDKLKSHQLDVQIAAYPGIEHTISNEMGRDIQKQLMQAFAR